MSKRKPKQSFCYAPTEGSGCIFYMRFFSRILTREWRRRKIARIIHIPGCIYHFALWFCKNIKKRTETLYQSFSPFMVEHTGFEPVTSTMRIDLDALSGLTRPHPLKTFLHYMRAILPCVSFTLFTPKDEKIWHELWSQLWSTFRGYFIFRPGFYIHFMLS